MKSLSNTFIITGALLALLILLVPISRLITPADPSMAAKKYIEAGDRYYAQKDYSRAAGEFSKAIKILPRGEYAYYARGRSYANNGNYAFAAVDLLKAVRLDPSGDTGKKALADLRKVRDFLKEANAASKKERAKALFKKWAAYIDEASACTERQDYAGARKANLNAITAAVASKNADPANSDAYAAVYFSKGYMYFINGSNYVRAVRPNFDNYSLLVVLRKSYYPLKCAQFYYDAALRNCTVPGLKKIIEGAASRNKYYLDNSSNRWLGSIDSKGRVFMKDINNEAEVTVNFDILNDRLAVQDFKSAAVLIDQNAKLINELKPAESTNVAGFVSMHNAYIKLYWALFRLDEDPHKNANIIRNDLNECLNNLHRARAGFANSSLANAAGELEKYVTGIMKNAN